MTKTRTDAVYSGTPYSGPVVIKTLSGGNYEWKVDNKRFILSDYSVATEEEIPNPYYREALIAAVTNATVTINPVPQQAPTPNFYRIWNYVSPDQIPNGNKLLTPFAVNYRGIDLTQRLHPRIWKHHGLVVQVIYYANYDFQTGTYSVPVVRERWVWDLDADTNFANSRTITIEWYGSEDDDTDPENPVPQIFGQSKLYTKHYQDTASKVAEIQKRRSNVIGGLEETVIGLLAMTETSGDVLAAITLGQALMTDINSLVANFVGHGDDDLANGIASTETRTTHPWLDNDCAAAGMPGVAIYQVMYNELNIDISDAINAFDFNSIPTY